MLIKIIIGYIAGVILIVDYFLNRNKKSIEMVSIGWEVLVFLLPFYMYIEKNDSYIGILGMFILGYLLKAYVVGSRIFFGNLDKLLIREIVENEIKNKNRISINFTERSIIIKSNLNIFKSYKLQKKLMKKLSGIDNRKNKSYLFLIYGLILILVNTYKWIS